MAGGGVSGGVVVRNHAVSRVGVSRGGAPPGRSQQESLQDEESSLDAEVVALLEKVRYLVGTRHREENL